MAYLDGGDRAYALVERFNLPNRDSALMRSFPRVSLNGEPRFSITDGTPGAYSFRVFPKPFAVGPLVGFVDSDVIVSDGASVGYTRYQGNGSVRRKVLMDARRRPPTSEELKREVDRVLEAAGSNSRLRDAVRDSALKLKPSLLPAVDRLIADRDGTVWLRRFLTEGNAETWVRVRADGGDGGVLTTPPGARLLAVNGPMLLLLSEDAATGIQQLRLHRLAVR